MTLSKSNVRAAAAWGGRSEVRRRLVDDDDRAIRPFDRMSLRDTELHRALEAVNFVAVHLKNDDEYAEVGAATLVLILLSFIINYDQVN